MVESKDVGIPDSREPPGGHQDQLRSVSFEVRG